MTTLKSEDARCPKCGSKTAEFKLASETFTRWSCSCGASGQITPIKSEAAPAKPAHKHWSTK